MSKLVDEKLKKTKEKKDKRRIILDIAEAFFSEHGIDGVSIRKITAAANVDLSLVNYYFGSKDKLFEEVLIRRVAEMSGERMLKLTSVDMSAPPEQVNSQILHNFVMPLIGQDISERIELENYRRLIALVSNSRRWQDLVFKSHYDPVAEEYIDALWQTNNHLTRSDVCWAFSFFLGSLTNAIAETGRIDRLSYGEALSSDLDCMVEKLISFTNAALRGMPGNFGE